jgi:heat shock protein HtpX
MSNTLKATVLLGAMTALIIGIGGLVGGHSGMLVALLIAGATNFVGYWFSGKIVLRMHGAREAAPTEFPALNEIVQRLSRAAGLPTPQVCLIESDTPNAFATGRNPRNAALAVTRGLLRLCDSAEIEAVIAHEISHIRNRDILVSSIAATLAGAVMVLASLLRWEMLFGLGDHRDGNGRGLLSTLALIILAPIAATLIHLGISRAREYQADNSGAALTGAPLELASALRKLAGFNARRPLEVNPSAAHLFIVNPLSGGRLVSLFSTHPPIEQRIHRLEEMARLQTKRLRPRDLDSLFFGHERFHRKVKRLKYAMQFVTGRLGPRDSYRG